MAKYNPLTQPWAITACRVSTPEQKENHSLDSQAKSILAAANRLGVYIPDDGQWSGSASSKCGKNVHRKDIQEMMDYCRKHKKVKYLLVSSPDRFMRSIQEAVYFEIEFKKLGVEIYYTDDESLNGCDAMTKFRRITKLFEAEVSNEERTRKGLANAEGSLKAGRTPYPPKFGYKRTFTPGMHVPNDDYDLAATLSDIMARIADGFLSVSDGLKELNQSDYFVCGGHALYKMDKWKKVLNDPYYAGCVEGKKQVKVFNPNALHQPLITKEQHERIVAIISNRKKCHAAPRKSGNTHYPLNCIMLCEECHKAEIAAGNIGIHDHSKFCGYVSSNGKGNQYDVYGCRRCHKRISREEAHAAIQEQISQFDLSDDGRKRILKQLELVWKDEERMRQTEIYQLTQRKSSLEATKNEQVRTLCQISDPEIRSEVEAAIKRTKEALVDVVARLNNLQNKVDVDKKDFMEFALSLVDNLADHFFDLTLEETKRCELLLFPGGFLVTSDKKVRTPQISPFYRGRTTKKDLPKSEKSFMAGDEGFEPPNAGTRTQCLTTWRIPSAKLLYHTFSKKSSKFAFFMLQYY